MSTHAVIAEEAPDGKVTAIYVHWDGYPSWVGVMLAAHWQDADKRKELFSLGDLSSLGEVIGEKHTPPDAEADAENWCRAFIRDNCEPATEDNVAKTYPNLAEFIDEWRGGPAEWIYVYRRGKWFFCHVDKLLDGLTELTEENIIASLKDFIAEDAIETEAERVRFLMEN